MKSVNVKISEEVKEILDKGRIEDNVYFLPSIQLSREQYVDVNKILELLGGKWNRSKKGHIFETADKAQELLSAKEQGEVLDKKKTYQFFETPSEIAEKIIELAEIQTGMTVLEPSAGHGAIIEKLPKDIELHIIEVDEVKCKVLESKGYGPVDCVDFLTLKPDLANFDRIVMNPPFTKGQDVDHILHAYSLLSDIGRLVSVAPSSITSKSQKKYKEVQKLIEEHGTIVELPQNSFKESGTNVSVVLVILDK